MLDCLTLVVGALATDAVRIGNGKAQLRRRPFLGIGFAREYSECRL